MAKTIEYRYSVPEMKGLFGKQRIAYLEKYIKEHGIIEKR